MARYFVCNNKENIVETTGGVVKGFSLDGISIFKGIPYAEAKRFHKPQPASWEGVKDCTSFGYVCPLVEMPEPNNELLVPHRYWLMDENCLNLNLWTPGLDDKKRPVIVWFHGGGFESGSAIEHEAYEGENMAKCADVVSISVNHRLNVLGYLDFSEFGEEYEDSGNNGTNDMIMSLQWVRDNVAKFGGDPDNVTIFGQSGGGMKVTTLLQTPAADGLFHKGMVMSGVIDPFVMGDSAGSAKEIVEALLDTLGLESVKELEEVPYDALAAAYLEVKPAFMKAGKNFGGSPHPNDFYAGDPLVTDFREETKNIPLLIGTVFGEFAGFVPTAYDRKALSRDEQVAMLEEKFGAEKAAKLIPVFEKAYPGHPVIDLLQLDWLFRHPTMEYIKKRSALNDCTWSYLFDFESELDGGTVPWHCADVPFFFHNTCMVPTTWKGDVTEKLEAQMFGAFMNFARTGDPNGDGTTLPAWPASSADAEHTMIFCEETHEAPANYDHELQDAYKDEVGLMMAAEVWGGDNADKIQH